MSTLNYDTQFSSLPLEIRNKIWALSLPPPRILQVIYNYQPVCYGVPATLKVVLASYGGHHPAALSVNKESRVEALRYLTLLHGAYWNLEIDTPCFEIKHNADDNVTALAEMAKSGGLVNFTRVAIDWKLWDWLSNTQSMEFKYTWQGKFNDYRHPFVVVNSLPNIKTCIFVHREHTLEKDIIAPYRSWYLGCLTRETTLDADFEGMRSFMRERIMERKRELERKNKIEIKIEAIHGRDREYLPPDQRMRKRAGWEMDWFG